MESYTPTLLDFRSRSLIKFHNSLFYSIQSSFHFLPFRAYRLGKQEEEESGSVGSRDWIGVPGAGSELGRGERWQRPGTGLPLGGCHSVAIRRGQGVFSPTPCKLLQTHGWQWLGLWGLVAE